MILINVINSKGVIYRRYTTPVEILCDNTAKKIHFIQKIESQAVFAEEEYTAWRRMFAA